jgi:hypothetical protein
VNGEGGTVETNEEGAVMEELELGNEEAVTKGERDAKSIVAPRDSCCVVVKFCVNAERTDEESVTDLADSDACACASVPPGVDARFVLRGEGLFIGVDNGEGNASCGDTVTVGGEEAATAPGDQAMGTGCAA